jgi:hypothetical protein
MKTLIIKTTFLSSLFIGCGKSTSVAPSSVAPLSNLDENKTVKVESENDLIDRWNLSSTTPPVYQTLPTDNIEDFTTIIYPNHPRIYFRDSDKEYLLNKKNSNEWLDLENIVKKLFNETKSFKEISETLQKTRETSAFAQMLFFYAYMTDDKYYKDISKRWALDVLAPEIFSDDTSVRFRIARLGELYDWLHYDLSDDEKKRLRGYLLDTVDFYMNMDQGKHPDFVQSHSRWGHGVVSQALLSMYGDFDERFTKKYADDMLNKMRGYLINYQNVERYIAEDGGWHLGWMYANFYGDYTFNYMVWSSATKECMLDDWMGELTYWFIYGLKSDDTFPMMGDTAANDYGMDKGEFAALYQKRYKKDPYAKLYLDRLKKSEYFYADKNFFIRFLLSDDTAINDANLSNLPLSRYFKKAGVVIARDGWGDDTTMLVFKSSTFYDAGHHDRDENSFTIDYKTPLAIDSGFYDKTDTPHYKNYYVRTIAHNGITVYNPNQKYYYYVHYNEEDPLSEKEFPNDGGQVYKEHDPVTLNDIQTVDALDGVTKYNFNGDYTYMQGDATKAYDPITVTLAKRDIVYLKDSGYAHPVTIVFDRVEATSGDFQKRYLLHMDSPDKPVIDGKKTTVISDVYTKSNDIFIQSQKVKMTNITLYPKDADLKVLGDVNKSLSSAYPYYDGMNIDTKPDENSSKVTIYKEDPRVKTGNWRLEVAPKTGAKYDQILNVISVGDENEQVEIDAKLIEGSNSLGVLLKDRVVLFTKNKYDLATPFEYKTQESGRFKYLFVTDYKKGETLKLTLNDKLDKELIVKDGGCVDFDLTATKNDIIKLSK